MSSYLISRTSIRADAGERSQTLAGDYYIAQASGSFTHAVNIDAPAAAVWPWLAQMGAGRGGWYSYDFLDNRGHQSARSVLPEYQSLSVGSVLPALPGVKDGFTVLECDPGRSLVLGWGSPRSPQPSTWSFTLADRGPGRTRLVVRARGAAGYRLWRLPPRLSRQVIRVVHWIMERKQLLTIKRRAEAPRDEQPGYAF